MVNELNALALGYSSAIISAVTMVLLGIFGNLGIYVGAVSMMQQWHMFFSLSVGGIIFGVVEASLVSFVIMYCFGLIYNKLIV